MKKLGNFFEGAKVQIERARALAWYENGGKETFCTLFLGIENKQPSEHQIIKAYIDRQERKRGNSAPEWLCDFD